MVSLRRKKDKPVRLPLFVQESARWVGGVLSAVAFDVLRHYRIGGLPGVLVGVSASIVLSQTRRRI